MHLPSKRNFTLRFSRNRHYIRDIIVIVVFDLIFNVAHELKRRYVYVSNTYIF